jgi:hypothetical protein
VKDDDADGDGVADGDEEVEATLAYLESEAIVGERFTVCLPDAEVPGGNGSIAAAVTPKRLIDYLSGESVGSDRVYSWGTPKAGPGDPDEAGDCDDDDSGMYPAQVCGTTPHFVADVSGPTATAGSLEVIRGEDGSVVVWSSPSADGQSSTCASMADDPCGPGVWARSSGESSMGDGFFVAQVLVQPPTCPSPFPGLLFVARGRSDDQLVYTGGWVIDDAALYEDSETVLSMSGVPRVVGVDIGDLDDDGLSDGIARSLVGEQGAQVVAGSVDALVEDGVLSESGGNDILVRKRPGKREYDIELTHVSLDAPVLHLVSASRVSQDVKFKAGAELSKSVN